MSKDIRDLVGLDGYEVSHWEEVAEDQTEVFATPPREGACPHCGVITSRVHQRAARPSRLLWGFLGIKQLVLVVRRQRFWCADCGRAFTQRLPGLRPRQRVAVAAQVSLLQWLREQSFSWVKRTVGVGYWRVRRILARLPLPWQGLDELAGTEGDIHLGVDEHSFRGNDMVLTITCLRPCRQLLAILPNDRQATLRTYLKELPEPIKLRVKAVCIDLKESFRTVIKQELAAAAVVADHFHVIADANRRVDETRRLEQAERKTPLKRWPLIKSPQRLSGRQTEQLAQLLTIPTLREHYGLKEQLRTLYTSRDFPEAVKRWSSLLVAMEASDDAEVVRWAKTLQRWRREILAFFQHRVTNGFTEGCHTKIKLLKRVSYGYRNRDVYRAKMLLGFLPTTSAALTPHLTT